MGFLLLQRLWGVNDSILIRSLVCSISRVSTRPALSAHSVLKWDQRTNDDVPHWNVSHRIESPNSSGYRLNYNSSVDWPHVSPNKWIADAEKQ